MSIVNKLKKDAHMSVEFTILMAVYEKDKVDLFKKAVASIYNNSVLPHAFILVVDGPVGPELRRQISESENRYKIQPIWLPTNGGLANALNAGLNEVETEWVVRADADDFNLPFRFEEQARLMTTNYDLIGGAIQEVDLAGHKLAIRRTPIRDNEIKKFVKYRNPFNHMTVAFRTELALQCGGYPNIYLKEDYALWALMIRHGARTANTSDILVEATTGRNMYKRRGGWRYANAEIKLQRHLVVCGIKSGIAAFFHGSARASVFLMPQLLRGWIYEHYLRDK